MSVRAIGVNCYFSGREIAMPQNDSDTVKAGDVVIFKDEDGQEEAGEILFVDREKDNKDEIAFTSKILRPATPNDLQKIAANEEKVADTVRQCKGLVEKHELEMQVFRAGYSFDGNKLHFTFTAEERVDFRELVKELAKVFKKQIYLRQVGPRDRARLIGGFGRCGRERCSRAFLKDLDSINMDMVRDQGLEGRGSAKLSGACGKLICSLKFEVEVYREFRKKLPRVGEEVRIKKGAEVDASEGKIIALDILNQRMRILLPERETANIHASEIEKIKRNGTWHEFKYEKELTLDNKSSKVKISGAEVESFMQNLGEKLKSE